MIWKTACQLHTDIPKNNYFPFLPSTWPINRYISHVLSIQLFLHTTIFLPLHPAALVPLITDICSSRVFPLACSKKKHCHQSNINAGKYGLSGFVFKDYKNRLHCIRLENSYPLEIISETSFHMTYYCFQVSREKICSFLFNFTFSS